MLQKCPVHRAVAQSTASFGLQKSLLAGQCIRPFVSRSPTGHRRLTTMASNEGVAIAYANALASLAHSNAKLDVIHEDLDRLSMILKDADGLADFLGNPVTDPVKKSEVLAKLCSEAGFDKDTENFLNVVMEKGRAGFFSEMCEIFEEEYCKMTDTLVATLTTAVQLDEEEHFEIAKKLQELSGAKNVKLKPIIDPSIIAGFTLEYGSSQIDLSVKGQLQKLSSELIEKASNT